MKSFITPALLVATLSIATLIFATPTYATPVQYQFTATEHTEFVNVGNPLPIGGYIIAGDVTVSGTFFYNADVPAIRSNDTTLLSSNLGLASIYSGAVTQFSGDVDGHLFSFDSGFTVVGDSAAGDPPHLDAIFNVAQLNSQPGVPATINFQGFSIGDFTLTGLSVYRIGSSGLLSDQSLPAPTINGAIVTALRLIFSDSQSNPHYADFSGLNITAVPVPASGVLFMSGVCGLFAAARKRLTRFKI
jgi:hypothetical protein